MNRKDNRQDSIVQQPQNRKGFSLVEMMVVLGIVTGAVAVVFGYITLTEKSKGSFYYQSSLGDLVYAVDKYKQVYGLENLTQDSLASSGLLPAAWTPLEPFETENGRIMLKTANEEFLLSLRVATRIQRAGAWVPHSKSIAFIAYKHSILAPFGKPYPREANLLHEYCQELIAEMPDLRGASCSQGRSYFRNGDAVYVQGLQFNIN